MYSIFVRVNASPKRYAKIKIIYPILFDNGIEECGLKGELSMLGNHIYASTLGLTVEEVTGQARHTRVS